MGLGLGNRLSASMRQRQEMVLAPRMLQAIEVLALPAADLEQWLGSEAEANEALVVERASCSDDELWLEPTRSSASRAKASDDHRALLEAVAAPGASLIERVEDELNSAGVSADAAAWIRFLADCLDDAGLLTLSDARLLELAEDAALPDAGTPGGTARLADAIATLQQFEPRGIGARSSVEALILQLDPEDEDYALLCALLEDFLVELSRNQRTKVARKLGIEAEELGRLLSVLERLDPRPAGELTGSSAPVLNPDLVAELDDEGRVRVELVRGTLPAVSVDADLEALYGTIDRGTEARAYLSEKLAKARSVAEAVELRGVTLLRVAELALGRQAAFLREGPRALVPLAMTEASEVLGLATSTVSRAVAGKHVQTPFGIVPLRTLFQSETAGTAVTALREEVGRLVSEEDPRAPLSDEALVSLLKERGHDVARRTVAKYRKELDIPSSYRRKR
ncbi:MAG: RNA polymerase factor sigma-54 [Planctomycetota bacterium]